MRNPEVLKGFSILLRAVATTTPAVGMLYIASDSLREGDSQEARAVNKAVVGIVSQMLSMPEADPEMVEHVLRNLPDTN